jgi:hypothetical protein
MTKGSGSGSGVCRSTALWGEVAFARVADFFGMWCLERVNTYTEVPRRKEKKG